MNHIEDGIVAAADAQSLGGVAAGSYALKTDVAPDSTMLGGKAPEYYLQPRNLLDNSNFTNPVNQRGTSSYSGNFVRSIDRWLAAEGASGSVSVKIEDGGITFTTSGGGTVYLIQRFEKGYLDLSKQYTIVAYMADGTVSFSGYIDTSEETMDGVNVTFPSGSKIKCVALYEGSYTADTLPPYVPKGYAAELTECQRYFQTIPYYFAQNSVNTNSNYPSYFPIQFFPMRIAPTVTLNESWNSNMVSKTTTSVTTRSLSIGFVLDSASNGYLQWNGSIILSADL